MPAGFSRWAPSPVLVAAVAATGLSGALLWWAGPTAPGVLVFGFVLGGWVVSLAFHELAHAAVAYVGGDRSVAAKGYLTGDIRRYADVGLSIVLPVVFVVLGGIGLPGGAVWIDRAALRSRLWRTAVALAGPAVNTAAAAVCLWAAAGDRFPPDRAPFGDAVAFMALLQVAATVLNLLPVPGLDGYGALEPWLPARLRARLTPVAGWGLLAVFAVLWWFEPANRVFWDTVTGALEAVGVAPGAAARGLTRFRFWL